MQSEKLKDAFDFEVFENEYHKGYDSYCVSMRDSKGEKIIWHITTLEPNVKWGFTLTYPERRIDNQ